MTETEDQTDRIRHHNDCLRTTGMGGRVMMTSGIAALPVADQTAVLEAVRAYTAFTADNDPYGEHDCASLHVGHLSVIWKIDYYDLGMIGHSIDPTDPSVTHRVLTIMLASDY